MIEFFIFILLLVASWLVWSGVFLPLFFLFGVFSVLLTVWLVHRMEVTDSEHYNIHLTYRAPFYWLWLIKEMLFSSLRVARSVWFSSPKLNPGMGWVSASQKSDEARVFFANSITLTPGTVACRVEGNKILVHALEKESLADLGGGKMDKKVTRSYE